MTQAEMFAIDDLVAKAKETIKGPVALYSNMLYYPRLIEHSVIGIHGGPAYWGIPVFFDESLKAGEMSVRPFVLP